MGKGKLSLLQSHVDKWKDFTGEGVSLEMTHGILTDAAFVFNLGPWDALSKEIQRPTPEALLPLQPAHGRTTP